MLYFTHKWFALNVMTELHDEVSCPYHLRLTTTGQGSATVYMMLTPQGGEHSGTEWLPTAKRPCGAETLKSRGGQLLQRQKGGRVRSASIPEPNKGSIYL